MKKAIVMLLVTFGLFGYAQQGKKIRPEREQLTSEQQVELQTKKMKLEFDLTDKQTTEVRKIVEKQVKNKEAKLKEMQAKKASGTKPTRDEIFAMRNAMLDEKIANKAEMKKILTEQQFAKFETKHAEQKEKKQKFMKMKRNKKVEDNEK